MTTTKTGSEEMLVEKVALPLAGYPVPEVVSTREHSLHCFACGGALSHSCCCERVTLHRDALRSLIFWVQTDTLDAALSTINSENGRLREALVFLDAEARRFAGFYPEASDGRNTFVIFADKIAALSSPPGEGEK